MKTETKSVLTQYLRVFVRIVGGIVVGGSFRDNAGVGDILSDPKFIEGMVAAVLLIINEIWFATVARKELKRGKSNE